jgi:serine/threonine protein kinase/Flp pilus assembly protein TadD
VTIKCPKCQAENPETLKFCGECGTQLGDPKAAKFTRPNVTETLQAPIHELTTGSTFANRYQIIEELGKGGMGKVYKVFDQEVQAKMALKLIKPEVAADKDTIDRFRNELKIARDISHKNICRMYDLGREAGNYFITMEYVSGEDLRSFIRRARQLVVGTAVFIAKQVCEGLAEAHRVGVVHRDLKPGNIMIDKEGNAKIMDFGIARSISVKGITGAGVMIGTPEYMSPEQVEGKEVDKRSDIYSLGIILYEMLTGQVPFEGDTPFTIGVKQKSEIPKDPKSLNAQIPQDLSRLILKCLEKEKERRYQNADELRANLEKIEKGIPTAERPVPKRKTATAKPITLTISRKKFFVPLSILIAIAIIGIGLWRFLPKHHAVPPPTGKPTLAILYFENNSGDQNLEFWKTGLTELLIAKLSQSKFINVLSSDSIYSILKKLNLDEAKKYTKEDLIEVANEGGATYTISGSIMKAEQNIIITLTLQKPHTGERISSIPVECQGEKEIMTKVDEVARTIKLDLDLTETQIAADLDREVGKITTSSPEAYKYYSEGRELHLQGKFSESISLMEKAAALDPGFAMAYRSMAIAFGNLGQPEESRKYLQKAIALGDRISEKERYIIEGDYYYRSGEKHYERAIKAYSKLFELYPEDCTFYNNFALIYLSIEEWDKAIELLEKDQKVGTGFPYPYTNQALAYAGKGELGKAKEVLENYLSTISGNALARRHLSYYFLLEKQFDRAWTEAEKAQVLSPSDYNNILVKGDISLYKGELALAESEYRKLAEREEPAAQFVALTRPFWLAMLQGKYAAARAQSNAWWEKLNKLGQQAWLSWARYFTAHFDLQTGNPETALKKFQELFDQASEQENVDFQRYALHGKGLAYMAMNQSAEALRAAVELLKMIEGSLNKKSIRLYFHLMGSIELKRSNFRQAIENLEKALPLMPFENNPWSAGQQALFFDSLAQAYLEAGQQEKALVTYEKITQLTSGRLAWGVIYAKSFCQLGKINEMRGDRVKAIENYQKFLDLWKDADPGLPEVEDARKRLGVS